MATRKQTTRSSRRRKAASQGRTRTREASSATAPAATPPPVQPAAHLINLRDGSLSSAGGLTTSEQELTAMFEQHLPRALEAARAAGRKTFRIMFFAHGGLTKEKPSMEKALRRVPWWLANDVYPIYFIWETGLQETLGQMLQRKIGDAWNSLKGLLPGQRGLFDFVPAWDTDPAVEVAARSIGGVAIWGAMKDSAARAAAPQTGGSWKTAQLLGKFLKKNQGGGTAIEVHAVGHSAGSIFHAHFLEAVHQAGGKIKSLHHLAPAIRVDLFKRKVVPLLGPGRGIENLTVYTMTDAKEQDDTCANVYHKSLLYLIYHALEPEKECPIFGLQRSIFADSALLDLFKPKTGAEVIWSPSNAGPRAASACLTHGGFDDDDATMNSVCRRIVDRDQIVDFSTARAVAPALAPVGASDDQVILGILTERALQMSMGEAPPVSAPAPLVIPVIPAPRLETGGRGARRLSLCIGIDDYPNAGDRLGGCVNDARNWHAFFTGLGFTSQLMLNADATWNGMRNALRDLVKNAQAGDVIAIQYSGHGTHVNDLDGDEEDDGQDEALCCYDFRAGKLLLDDDIGAELSNLRPGVNFNLFMDCCHSGSNTRVAANFRDPLPEGTKARYALPTVELNEANAAFRKVVAARNRVGAGRKRDGNPYEGAGEVLFAAALPNQLANEIGGAGVFTSTALPVLQKGLGNLTNGSFMEAVQAAFPAAFRRRQEPRLYCASAAARRALLLPLG